MNAAFLLVLSSDKAPLFLHLFVVLGQLTAQQHGGFGRVLAVKLHFRIQRLAPGLQLSNALGGRGGHRIDLHNGQGPLGIVRGLVGVARNQNALALALVDDAVAFFQLLAALYLQCSAFMFGESGP